MSQKSLSMATALKLNKKVLKTMDFLKKIFSPITTTLGFIQNHFKAMIFLLILFLLFAPQEEASLTPNNLTKIKLTGPIFDVSEVVEQLNEAAENTQVKGVLFVVDSPGGSVPPSIELAYALKRIKNSKPVLVYAAGTLASGSYYASIYADEIMANPGSMVGSIGVIMQGANVSELMSKIGIKTQIVSAGKYKQVGTPDRAWKDYETAELEKVIDDTYDMFTQDVATARGLDIKNRDHYANAHIFTARQAKEVGLIDSIGVEYDAKAKLVELSKVDKPVWNKEDKFDKFMKKIAASSALTLHTYFPSLILK